MVKGVIFDMDGTMFDTERISTISWWKVGEKYNLDMTEEFIANCRGKNPTKIRELFEERFDMDFTEVHKSKRQFTDAMIEEHGVPIKKGLVELLQYLNRAQIPAAVATSTAQARAEQLLKLAGVYDYFTGYMYGDLLTISKPEPDIFLEAAKKIGQTPENCLVLEDSTAGVQAGIAAGGYVIYVPDESHVPEEVKQGISAELEDLERVITWIEKENQTHC